MKRPFTRKCSAKHKLLTENIQEIIIFFDSNGKIVECNMLAINELGYGEGIYNIPIYEIFINAFSYENNKLEITDQYQLKPEETIAYRKNETCFPVRLKIATVNERGSFLGLCTAKNISKNNDTILEARRLKHELKSVNQIRNEFVANITHELRTPVNGIMGLSDNLLDMELQPRQYEIVSLIKRCCDNMDKIINDLLDYTKISNNKMVIEQREFNFRKFIQHIIDLYKARIDEKGLKLLVNISSDIPDRIIGDELRLTQILNNLFSNSIKFTSVGQIALEIAKISETDQTIELFFMIIDTGIGISLEEKDKLFQSFSQVDGSITRRFGGTGLGLSISKKLVEAMHGTITVDSEKGKGSTFSFSVRLGIPQGIQEVSSQSFVMEPFDIHSTNNGRNDNMNSGNVPVISNFSYMDKLLQEMELSTPNQIPDSNYKEKLMKEIEALLEKLSICIEMENWQMAEELVEYIKKITPEGHAGEVSKTVFRLLLSVRKENYDTSKELLNALRAFMKESGYHGK